MANVFTIFDTVVGSTNNYFISSTATPNLIVAPSPTDNVGFLAITGVGYGNTGGGEVKRGTWK